ncbi:MAG: dTDP-4-dehydrorhamnose 3,5-epimerase family protein [Promethearchaeota archaeon]|jgi:dTDP-4-dehydrorhamnose 3,5-epimerase
MNLAKKSIDGVYEITTQPAYVDRRGSLVRIFDAKLFKKQGIKVAWQQQSISYTRSKNILRGLHLQRPPFSESKLITVLNGKMYWVTVDIRKESPTFGKWEAVTLSPEGISGLLVLRGFAHGCLSLTDECLLIINADNNYSTDYGMGIAWNDPDLNIYWPLGDDDPYISDAHRAFPSFEYFKSRCGGI